MTIAEKAPIEMASRTLRHFLPSMFFLLHALILVLIALKRAPISPPITAIIAKMGISYNKYGLETNLPNVTKPGLLITKKIYIFK